MRLPELGTHLDLNLVPWAPTGLGIMTVPSALTTLHAIKWQSITEVCPAPHAQLGFAQSLPFGPHLVQVRPNSQAIGSMERPMSWPSLATGLACISVKRRISSWGTKDQYTKSFEPTLLDSP